jgi:hypothetical protein
MSNSIDESKEHWGNLRGPAAVYGRLLGIEMRLDHMRDEVEETAHWAEHPACPDISVQLNRIRDLLDDAEREVRQARERRLHGS